jgi:hypothetical protein
VQDRDESLDVRRNVAVADIPALSVEIVAQPAVFLDVTYEDSNGQEESFGDSFSNEQSSELSKSDSTSTTVSAELSITIGTEVTASLPPSASVSAEVSASVGFERTTSTEVTATTARAFTQESSREQTRSVGRTVTAESGRISMGVEVENQSDVAYRVSGLAVTVSRLQQDENGDRSKQVITTLQPPSPAFDVISMAGSKGSRSNTMALEASDLNVDVVRSFLANPSSLIIEPASFVLTDANGQDFVFTADANLACTALVIVDYGRGVAGNVVRAARVATVMDRTDDGVFAGTRLDTALAVAGFDAVFEDAITADGPLRVLTSIDGVAAEPADHAPAADEPIKFWVAIGRTENGVGHPDVDAVDMDSLRLKSRDEIRLVYVEDADRDNLNSREEFLFGLDDTLDDTDGDTDGDTLTDFEELKGGGWDVVLEGGTRHVFSSGSEADADQDGLDDSQEQAAGTDPFLADTDGDGVTDAEEVGGWDVSGVDAGGAFSRHVASSPLLADTDLDGLDDRVELERGTDPTVNDTDGDTFLDDEDRAPATFQVNTAPSLTSFTSQQIGGGLVRVTWTGLDDAETRVTSLQLVHCDDVFFNPRPRRTARSSSSAARSRRTTCG